MKRYQPHPIALLYPPMSPEEYEFVKEDIRQHGLKHPIVLLEGKILDGWQRYQICLELGTKPQMVPLARGRDADRELNPQWGRSPIRVCRVHRSSPPAAL